MYFNMNPNIIQENWIFDYDFHYTKIKPAMLDVGNEIILAIWSTDKHTDVTKIMVFLPKILLILMFLLTEVFCIIVKIEEGNNFPLESLAACPESSTEFTKYFTVNLAFVNHFDYTTT